MSIFKNIFNSKSLFQKTMALIPKHWESEFRVGQIIKMSPGAQTTKPYYVEVIYYNPKANQRGDLKMITSIPGRHETEMEIGNNWSYHHRRMTIIGDKSKFGHLLLNQELC